MREAFNILMRLFVFFRKIKLFQTYILKDLAATFATFCRKKRYNRVG